MTLPPRRKKPKTQDDGRIRCPSHVQWVRGHECIVHMHGGCVGKIQAHHVRKGTDGAASIKPSDIWVVSLCSFHHGEAHAIGHDTFEAKYKVNLYRLAEDFARTSPHRKKWA